MKNVGGVTEDSSSSSESEEESGPLRKRNDSKGKQVNPAGVKVSRSGMAHPADMRNTSAKGLAPLAKGAGQSGKGMGFGQGTTMIGMNGKLHRHGQAPGIETPKVSYNSRFS